MRPVPIGAMRHRIILQQPVRVADGGGGATESWDTVAELWAAVQAIDGEERLAADALAGELTHVVWLRYRGGLVPSMRFLYDGRSLEIRAVVQIDGRRRRLKCLCLERNL
jgi:SPP1 family predicted phage head-tail adaptor